jgi:prepilin signal peptidase PulO-like enzyme (type II secretory pathway)
MDIIYFRNLLSYLPLPLRIYYYTLVFFIGALVSDFFQCMIWRHANRVNPFIARSRCDSCGRTLKWRHLVPVVSFLFMKGRCSYCGSRIDINYFFSDLIAGTILILLTQSGTDIIVFAVFSLVLIFVLSHDFLSGDVPFPALLLLLASTVARMFFDTSHPFVTLYRTIVLILIVVCFVCMLLVKKIVKLKAIFFTLVFSLLLTPIGLAVGIGLSSVFFGMYLIVVLLRDRRIPAAEKFPLIPFIGLGLVSGLVFF